MVPQRQRMRSEIETYECKAVIVDNPDTIESETPLRMLKIRPWVVSMSAHFIDLSENRSHRKLQNDCIRKEYEYRWILNDVPKAGLYGNVDSGMKSFITGISK